MPNCAVCGEPMPAGEEMFQYHGYSGPCPRPPLARPALPQQDRKTISLLGFAAFSADARFAGSDLSDGELLTLWAASLPAVRERWRFIADTVLNARAALAATGTREDDHGR